MILEYENKPISLIGKRLKRMQLEFVVNSHHQVVVCPTTNSSIFFFFFFAYNILLHVPFDCVYLAFLAESSFDNSLIQGHRRHAHSYNTFTGV